MDVANDPQPAFPKWENAPTLSAPAILGEPGTAVLIYRTAIRNGRNRLKTKDRT